MKQKVLLKRMESYISSQESNTFIGFLKSLFSKNISNLNRSHQIALTFDRETYHRRGPSQKVKNPVVGVEKTDKTGKKRLYYVSAGQFTNVKGFFSISPSKGGGHAILAKKKDRSGVNFLYNAVKR